MNNAGLIKYIIISPVRDEEKYIKATLDSVVAQSMPPMEWVLVDDGSTDGTAAIIETYAARYDWIRLVKRPDRGYRKPGSGVIDAFYEGYSNIAAKDWRYIVKLDGDLSFSPEYFEKCFIEFQNDPGLGVCGGDIYNIVDGVPVLERVQAFHVRGATKIYSRACWDGIGGLLKVTGWDTLDEIKANMLGWKTMSLPALKLLQHRSTGAAEGNWRDSFKNGRANYISGYHPVFFFLKCVKRLFQPPYLIGSAGLLTGFVGGYLLGVRQVEDPELIRYLRKQQLRSLVGLRSLWNQ